MAEALRDWRSKLLALMVKAFVYLWSKLLAIYGSKL